MDSVKSLEADESVFLIKDMRKDSFVPFSCYKCDLLGLVKCFQHCWLKRTGGVLLRVSLEEGWRLPTVCLRGEMGEALAAGGSY